MGSGSTATSRARLNLRSKAGTCPLVHDGEEPPTRGDGPPYCSPLGGQREKGRWPTTLAEPVRTSTRWTSLVNRPFVLAARDKPPKDVHPGPEGDNGRVADGLGEVSQDTKAGAIIGSPDVALRPVAVKTSHKYRYIPGRGGSGIGPDRGQVGDHRRLPRGRVELLDRVVHLERRPPEHHDPAHHDRCGGAVRG